MTTSFLSRQMSALEEFEHALNETYLIKEAAKTLVESLRAQFEDTERGVQEARQILEDARSEEVTNSQTIEALTAQLRDLEIQLRYDRDRLSLWRREVPRQIAIRYCSLFETFLRKFLVEQLESGPHRLEKYILVNANKELKEFPKNLGLNVVITAPPKERDEIDAYLTIRYRTFQSTNDINCAYQAMLDKKPFDKFISRQTVFNTAASYRAAQADVRLLFAIRHKIIHRNGDPDKSYRKALRGHGCWERISNELKAQIQDPWPDAILTSNAVGSSCDKLDEFADSLLSYAQYIAEICE